MAYESLMVFTGNANPLLAHAVVRRLNIPIGHATVGKFSDGEIMVELLENVRGKDCFVLQSTCAPANDSLMEVLLIVDALKRASAARVTAAIPYFGYARQDRRPRSARVAISAKVAANMLQASGVDRVMTMDLHLAFFADSAVDSPAYAVLREQFGYVPNLYRLQSAVPELLDAEVRLLESVLFPEDGLNRVQKECVLLAISAANLNTYSGARWEFPPDN